MPIPYTRRRSRNRTRPNALQPANASPAQVTAAVHGSSKTTITFNQAMNTALVGIPAGLAVNGGGATGVTWTDDFNAELATATTSAGQAYSMPANNTWRTIAGGPVAASAGLLT